MGEMHSVDGIDELYDAVQSGLMEMLKQRVAPIAEEILRKHIKSDVYVSREPHPNAWVHGETYVRRHLLENSVTTETESDHSIVITSTAVPGESIVKGSDFVTRYSGAFLQLLESGHMGILKSGVNHAFPRPVVTNAERTVQNSSEIRRAIKDGIKSMEG